MKIKLAVKYYNDDDILLYNLIWAKDERKQNII